MNLAASKVAVPEQIKAYSASKSAFSCAFLDILKSPISP